MYSQSHSKRVAILLATYNGEAFLPEQLNSLMQQKWPAIDIWASDDGSTDHTLVILREWQQIWPKGDFQILQGPKAGFAENFRSMIINKNISSDYIAFCDQDDIWSKDKLTESIYRLSVLSERNHAGLYVSRTRLVDARGQLMGYSPLYRRSPGFRNALVQNIASGNTFVLNRFAFEILAKGALRTSFVFHDWWCYLLISGAGGRIHYDPIARISYRQHGGNMIGIKTGLGARVRRLRRLLNGGTAPFNQANIAALEQCEDLLTEESCQALERFKAVRKALPPMGLFRLMESGVYRQDFSSNAALAVAAALGRL